MFIPGFQKKIFLKVEEKIFTNEKIEFFYLIFINKEMEFTVPCQYKYNRNFQRKTPTFAPGGPISIRNSLQTDIICSWLELNKLYQ